jgi:hypothetical protein
MFLLHNNKLFQKESKLHNYFTLSKYNSRYLNQGIYEENEK